MPPFSVCVAAILMCWTVINDLFQNRDDDCGVHPAFPQAGKHISRRLYKVLRVMGSGSTLGHMAIKHLTERTTFRGCLSRQKYRPRPTVAYVNGKILSQKNITEYRPIATSFMLFPTARGSFV